MLLNTDLHVAEISSRMSKSQFIKNTINVVFAERSKREPDSPVSLPAAVTSRTSFNSDEDEDAGDQDDDSTRHSSSTQGNTNKVYGSGLRHKKRSGSLTSWRNIMQGTAGSMSAVHLELHASDSPEASRVSLSLSPVGGFDSPTGRASRDTFGSTRRLWEIEVEQLLKVSGLTQSSNSLFSDKDRRSRICTMQLRNNKFCSLHLLQLVLRHHHSGPP
jgi:hypothetical protein